jgi:hypothetical protein
VRDRGPLPGIAGPREGFGQPARRALAAGARVGRRQLTQHAGPFSGRRGFGERAAQLVAGLGRRAGRERGPGRLAKAPGHPGVAGRLHMHQVGGDPAGGGAVPVQLVSCGAVHPVTLVAAERGVDRSPNHRVKEARRVRRRQDLHPDERGGQPDGRVRVQAGHGHGVPELGLVSEHGQGLGQAERGRIEPADPRLDVPGDGLAGRESPAAGFRGGLRAQQLAEVERVPAARLP